MDLINFNFNFFGAPISSGLSQIDFHKNTGF